jgi:predicted nucleic acid-binding protein
VIVDTSAWVEYLRATGSDAHRTLRARIETGDALATPAPAVMELLAGCRSEEAAERLRRLLARFEILEVGGVADFEDAALIQRICRRGGETVRSMTDCLIAAIALRERRPLLAIDRDFERIARHVGLELVGVSAPPREAR